MHRLFTNSDLNATPKVGNRTDKISGMGRPRSRQTGPHADFGRRFQQACAEARIPTAPKERCRRFGVNPTTIGNWEHGDKLPSMENAVLIAEVTGSSVDWLMTGRGEMHPGKAASGSLDISHLSSDSQAAIRALVHSLEHQGAGHSETG